MRIEPIEAAAHEIGQASEAGEAALSRLRGRLEQALAPRDRPGLGLPKDVAEMLVVLSEHVEVTTRWAHHLNSMVRDEVITVFEFVYLAGQKLTFEQYALLAARQLVPCGKGDTRRDYEQFLMLYYEDDDRHGYIDLNAPLPSPPGYVNVRMTLGNEVAPEEVRVDALRPEQRGFLAEHYPEIYVRFREA